MSSESGTHDFAHEVGLTILNLRKRPPAPGQGPRVGAAGNQARLRRERQPQGADLERAIYEWTHACRRRRGCCKSMPFGNLFATPGGRRTMCDPVGRRPRHRAAGSCGDCVTARRIDHDRRRSARPCAFAPNYFFWSWLFRLVEIGCVASFSSTRARLDSSRFVVRHKLKLGDRFSRIPAIYSSS